MWIKRDEKTHEMNGKSERAEKDSERQPIRRMLRAKRTTRSEERGRILTRRLKAMLAPF